MRFLMFFIQIKLNFIIFNFLRLQIPLTRTKLKLWNVEIWSEGLSGNVRIHEYFGLHLIMISVIVFNFLNVYFIIDVNWEWRDENQVEKRQKRWKIMGFVKFDNFYEDEWNECIPVNHLKLIWLSSLIIFSSTKKLKAALQQRKMALVCFGWSLIDSIKINFWLNKNVRMLFSYIGTITLYFLDSQEDKEVKSLNNISIIVVSFCIFIFICNFMLLITLNLSNYGCNFL